MQMSAHEDTLMPDMNVVEDPPNPEPPFNISTSSPTGDNRSPKAKSLKYETDDAMQGVETEKGINTPPSKKAAMNPDTVDWLKFSPDVKEAKKTTEQDYLSHPRNVET